MSAAPELSPLAQIAGGSPTNIEGAHRAHAQAVDRLRQLEGSLEQAFGQLHVARQELKDRAGVDAVVRFGEPMTCAFERWHAIAEAQERAVSDPSPESLDVDREEQALRIANAGAEA